MNIPSTTQTPDQSGSPAARARVADLMDAACDSESPCLLEVDCIAFAEVRKGDGQ